MLFRSVGFVEDHQVSAGQLVGKQLVQRRLVVQVRVKLLRIQIYEGGQVCCSKDAPPDNCPLWFNKWQWMGILFLATFRVLMVSYFERYPLIPCCQPSGYQPVPSDSAPAPDCHDDDEELKSIQVRKPRTNKLSSIYLGKPRRSSRPR